MRMSYVQAQALSSLGIQTNYCYYFVCASHSKETKTLGIPYLLVS